MFSRHLRDLGPTSRGFIFDPKQKRLIPVRGVKVCAIAVDSFEPFRGNPYHAWPPCCCFFIFRAADQRTNSDKTENALFSRMEKWYPSTSAPLPPSISVSLASCGNVNELNPAIRTHARAIVVRTTHIYVSNLHCTDKGISASQREQRHRFEPF